MRNQSKLERAGVSEAKYIDKLCVGAFATRHEAQMQTERDRPCVAKKMDRLSDGVVGGTQIEPARAIVLGGTLAILAALGVLASILAGFWKAPNL